MSIIKIPIHFEGELGEKTLYTLFDSGSTYSCIRPEFVKDLVTPIKFKNPLHFGTASEGAYIAVKEACRLEFYMDDTRLTDEFYIVPGLSEEAIIGATTMQKWRIKLDFETDLPIVDPKVAKLILINLIKK
ncbi:MAG: retropepsin-like domain-containing protein [Cytophagales bacterium]|nr:retropepsin-like domain-containing protein [Cytophagales bacterium]